MSTQALGSERTRDGLKDVLLGPAPQALRAAEDRRASDSQLMGRFFSTYGSFFSAYASTYILAKVDLSSATVAQAVFIISTRRGFVRLESCRLCQLARKQHPE